MTTQGLTEATTTAPRFRVTLKHVSLVLVFLGLLVSGYLSYVKFFDVIGQPITMVCNADAGFNCSAVQNSAYSLMFGIPIAWLGFATYVVIGGLLLLQDRVQFLRDYGMLMLFGIVTFAFVYSMFLVYVQGVVLQAWCQWCLMHEAIMTVLFVVTILRFRNDYMEAGEE